MSLGGRLPYWAVLIILAGLGLAGLIVPAWLGWTWDRGVIGAISTALLVAAILGLTIDRWMKTEIAANVFNAAFGYFMPEEFQAEIRKITSFQFMSEECDIIYSLAQIDLDTVSIRMQAERRIRNITNAPATLQVGIHIDEWSFAARSAINKCEIKDKTGNLLADITNIEDDRGDSTMKTDLKPVVVMPKDYVVVVTDYVEIRRKNDHFTTVFKSPIKNPRVTVHAPSDFEFLVDFGVLEQMLGISSISTTRTLNGVYFPPGHIRCRWWPKRLPNLPSPG